MALATAILIAGTRGSQPAASASNNGVYYRVTDEANIVEQSTGAAWVRIAGGGGLIGIQTITATGAGTYTPTAGTSSVVIELQGAGGGGGGVAQPGGTSVALARGGGGGGWVRTRLTTAFSGAGYVVGAKGTGGTAGNNAGTNGGDTTFTATGGGGTVYTAGGGTGGNGSGAQTAPLQGGISAGGTCTNGSEQQPGSYSINANCVSALSVLGGRGGSSRYAPGAEPPLTSSANTSTAGNNAVGKGGGGSGASAAGTGAAAAGGNGSDGLIIIWEYA